MYYIWTVNHKAKTASRGDQGFLTQDEAQVEANRLNGDRRDKARKEGWWSHVLPDPRDG